MNVPNNYFDVIEQSGQQYQDALKLLSQFLDKAIAQKIAMQNIGKSFSEIKEVINRSKEWEKRAKTGYGKFTFQSKGGNVYTF